MAAAGVDLSKIRRATPEELAAIWRDLDEVGRTKAVGYLPRESIRKFCGKTVEEAAQVLTDRGLSVRVLSQHECHIGSGALFAFDRFLSEEIIARHADTLRKKGWPPDVDQVITNITMSWFEADDPAMPLIRALYNDTFGYAAPTAQAHRS